MILDIAPLNGAQ